MFFDLPLEELQKYLPRRDEPSDFDLFWKKTIDEARAFPLDPIFSAVETGLQLVDVFDVAFAGYGGQPVKGWFIFPHESKEPLPCVVEYVGYGGGRGLPIDWLFWANAGYAHFVMDVRGQGSAWRTGDTPDPEPEGGNAHFPGFMTRGILNPHAYYYRRVFTDAVRAVEAARSHSAVDGNRIIVTGGSQGGGIALAAAGLIHDLAAAMIDVPFLSHIRQAVSMTDEMPYREIAQFCRMHREKIETVFSTLSYFDGMNFAVRASAPALFSAGLMDIVCPPRTVFAAYNYYSGKKEIRVWQFNAHEGGESFQNREKIQFLRRELNR